MYCFFWCGYLVYNATAFFFCYQMLAINARAYYRGLPMKKLFAVVVLGLAASVASAADAPAKYATTCFACHSTGAANAPKTGDAAAWEPRLAKGMDAMIASVKGGMAAMPPTGLCSDCSDEEYKALIEYMATPAK
jgi:cytochrome c5